MFSKTTVFTVFFHATIQNTVICLVAQSVCMNMGMKRATLHLAVRLGSKPKAVGRQALIHDIELGAVDDQPDGECPGGQEHVVPRQHRVIRLKEQTSRNLAILLCYKITLHITTWHDIKFRIHINLHDITPFYSTLERIALHYLLRLRNGKHPWGYQPKGPQCKRQEPCRYGYGENRITVA